ncbi:peptide ABC transporter substrate-binding protein [Chloroflexota bacterium]
MKKLRWQIVIVVVALAAIAVLLYGQQPVIQTVAPEPSTGGVYIEGLVGQPSRFNPLLDFYNQADRDVDRLIFSSMLKFDAWGNPIPDLAEAWGVSVTGDVFNVTLRENALWHDGEPVTSADVVFTIELMRDPAIPVPDDLRELWDSVEVIAFDDYNLQFRLPEPYVPFVDYLAFGVLPKHLLDGKTGQEFIDASFNLSPVGSGPYQFQELIVEDGQITGLVLSPFDDYYLDRPFIDQIVFRYYPSTQEALLAYQEGEILGISPVGGDALRDVLAEPGLNVYTARLPQLSMVVFNLSEDEEPLFQDSNVRKALLMALNRRWIIDVAVDGQAMLANGPIFPGSWAYYDEGLEGYDYNPSGAVDLLREAGFVIPAEGGDIRQKDDMLLSFELVHLTDVVNTAIAEIIQQNWAEVGVQVQLVAVDEVALMDDYLTPRTYQAALIELSLARTPDPDPYPFWHQSQISGGQNYSLWNDRRASEYLENARVVPQHLERFRLYRNFQVHFNREMPALPLFYPMYSYAVDLEVEGVAIGPLYDPSDRFANVNAWFLVSKPGVQPVETPTETQTP